MNIYIGNLSRDVTEEELRLEFEAFGQVATVSIIKDKYSGQPRGFGFVEMPTKSEGEAAIAGLKGKTLKDRTLDVNEARPRTDSRGGGFGGGGGGGGRTDKQFTLLSQKIAGLVRHSGYLFSSAAISANPSSIHTTVPVGNKHTQCYNLANSQR
ncbi:RNA recognition motif domain-containing protein [Chloroflexota bacterium]